MFLRNNNSYHPNRYYIHYRNQLERPVQVLTFLKTATMVIKRWRPDRYYLDADICKQLRLARFFFNQLISGVSYCHAILQYEVPACMV
ncbi:hypothetical protein IGI04_012851 [Brassica rapa subsp. trilocularis]|uniref:Uncharacterized protein n=1 Tax=Brassica rapa subsp. trilocularis TaxID=1813537 RepID=A0ABQ7N763_BRACM|nr:hypothetical protein IGI04_012851 [Brassica rapa subsp. trilocularis]